jgi:predicted permease
MAWTGRLANLFRRARLSDELDEEMAAHIDESIAMGRSAQEARRAFGSTLRIREQSMDVKLIPWLEALVSDVVFAWRQLRKNRAVTAAAILSLSMAVGATTAAFRLLDAVLLRQLPVREPEQLLFVAVSFVDRNGHLDYHDIFDYPTFRQHLRTVGDKADVMVLGMSGRQDARVGAADAVEKVYRQYVSGNVFGVFGLQPALGRLLTLHDDRTPGAHQVAVLSYDYWTRRFGRDPAVLGQLLRLGNRQYEVVGVAPKRFTGTQPGTVTDVFIPAVMNVAALDNPSWAWFRIWVRPKPGVMPEQIRQPLQAALTHEHRERVKSFPADTPKQSIDEYLGQEVLLYPAGAGASPTQKAYRRPLIILATLVGLVLLIACANVASLLTAQGAARAREMALRVSIGAGRWRLIQLLVVESALIASFASIAGFLFASWSAPLVVSMLAPPEDPIRLILDPDWRALGFGIALTVTVILLFGLPPALRASAVKPISALKGGEDPHVRGRLIDWLIAAQVAFCVLVLLLAGLFTATFDRLSNRPLGFSHERVLAVETESRVEHPPEIWAQVADHLRRMPGVESVSLAGWALLTGNQWTGSVRMPGRAVEPRAPYFLDVSPGFFATMGIKMLDGRDFRPGDVQARVENNQAFPGVGIVNEAFARTYFGGQNPVGRSVDLPSRDDMAALLKIIGYVRDASYGSVREPMRPTVYVPVSARGGATILIRSAGDPLALAPMVRSEVTRARAEFRVRNIETQSALVRRHMLRERLLATLSLFFATVALVLACVGLYGVLNYSVIQQRREIGIRMALGARSADVVRQVTANVFGRVCLGSVIGVAAGLACERFVESLLFEIKATDPAALVTPIATLAGAAVLAALPPAVRAVRIDPAQTLRNE